jgi:hypothetical protein
MRHSPDCLVLTQTHAEGTVWRHVWLRISYGEAVPTAGFANANAGVRDFGRCLSSMVGKPDQREPLLEEVGAIAMVFSLLIAWRLRSPISLPTFVISLKFSKCPPILV